MPRPRLLPRERLIGAGLVALALSLGRPSTAGAQVAPPVPAVPASPAPSSGSRGPAATPADAQRWSFTATLGQSHTDSLFLISPEDPGDVSDLVTVALSYGRASERVDTTASGYVSATRYRTFSQFDRMDYGLSAGLAYRPSRTASFVFGQSAGSGFYAPLLTDLRIQIPQVHIDVLNSNAQLLVRPSPRGLVKLEGEFGYLRYNSDLSTLDATQLPFDPLILVGLPPDDRSLGLSGLPTPVDATVLALGALAAEGVTRRRLNLLTYRGALQLSQDLAPRTSAALQLGYRALRYDSAGLSSGAQFSGDASLKQAFSPTTVAQLQYTYERNTAQVPAVTTQTGRLQLTRDWSPHLKGDLSVGVGWSGMPGGTSGLPGSSNGTAFIGGLGFTGSHRRTRYDAHYGRTVFQALGFGRNYVSDYASAYVDQTFTKRFAARLDGNYRHSQDVFAQAFFFNTSSYAASARYRIQRRTAVEASYVLRRVDRGAGQPSLQSSLWFVSLVYTRVFK